MTLARSSILFLILFLFQVCCQTSTWADQRRVFRVSDGKTITYEKMIEDLRKATLVFVGETHDNELHHRLQLEIIRDLYSAKAPIAVGMEMFTASSQEYLNSWIAGKINPDDFIRVYYKNWGFPWPVYRDILLYVRDNKIPTIGLNIPPEISRKVASSGFSSLSKEEREKLPPETGCAVDEHYMKFIKRAYAMHGHGGKQFLHFCEAQLLWDQVMAVNLVEFLRKNPGRMVVVLTGNGHAWKRGIPEQVRMLSSKISYRVALPDVPGSTDPANISVEDADYILLK